MQHLRTLNAVAGRLSLRPPQSLSLRTLAQAIEAAPGMLRRDRSLDAVLATLVAETVLSFVPATWGSRPSGRARSPSGPAAVAIVSMIRARA